MRRDQKQEGGGFAPCHFGLPLHILSKTDKSSSWVSGLAEINLTFLIYTIDPDLGRIEAELNYKIFAGTDLYCEFDRDTLLAMNPVKSVDVMQKETSSGVLLINAYRRKKNRPPVEGGDTPLVNSTDVPLSIQTASPQNPSTGPPQQPEQA